MPDRGDGACVHLGPDNLCTIYETRPEVCNMEKMYEKRLKDNPETMEKLGKKGYFAFNNLVCNAMMEEDKMPEEYRIPVCLDDIQLNEAGGFIETLLGDNMGGNDIHDKYGRPYELDDGQEALYDRLEDTRDELDQAEQEIQLVTELLKTYKQALELYDDQVSKEHLSRFTNVFEDYLDG